jgi:hypothetical protein
VSNTALVEQLRQRRKRGRMDEQGNPMECQMGENCPNWRGWTDEVGGLIRELDERIATLTELVAVCKEFGDSSLIYEAKLIAYENIRRML